MKITGLLAVHSSANRVSQPTTGWFGRTVTPLVKNVLTAALLLIFLSVVVCGLRNYLSQKPNSSPKPSPNLSNEWSEFEVTKEKKMTIDIPTVWARLNAATNMEGDPNEVSKFDPARDRYDNILQPKSTMVEVRDEKGKKIEYNGAKFSAPNKREYILMQGPLPTTIECTKKMIQQNGVKQIVCLTKHVENTKVKCEPYWKLWNAHQLKGYSLRNPDPTGSEAKEWGPELKMFHYEEWPDFGVPSNIKLFIQFIELQRKAYKEGPVVVHCSAGVGRSGVYMVATLMMDQIEAGEKTLNPLKLIALLRQTRPGMVQAPEQLQFCFDIANRLLART